MKRAVKHLKKPIQSGTLSIRYWTETVEFHVNHHIRAKSKRKKTQLSLSGRHVVELVALNYMFFPSTLASRNHIYNKNNKISLLKTAELEFGEKFTIPGR